MAIPQNKLPTVALVGRVNVGKSTLFNRLLGVPQSLVSSIPGTTRDIQEAIVTWRGVEFYLLDTGGITSTAPRFAHEDGTEHAVISRKVMDKSRDAIARADLILLITDAQEGSLPSDRQAADSVRPFAAKVITVVNKADNPSLRMRAEEFARLGFGSPIPLSAINGTGTGDLLDIIVARLAANGARRAPLPARAIRLAIVGRPNVGKSTLVNAILGFERAIVSPYAHTTREPVDTPFIWRDTPLLLIDTAGIRKKARITRGLERAGVQRSIAVLERADIALFVVDIAHGIDDQDKQLGRLIAKSGVGVVLVQNKWDLIHAGLRGLPARINPSEDLGARHLNYIYGRFPFLAWAPSVFASALNKSHIKGILDAAIRVERARSTMIADKALAAFFTSFCSRHPLPSLGIQRRKTALVHFLQTKTRPPAFELAVKTKERFPDAYIRILEKEIRKQYDLEGTPIRIALKALR